jgi:hypothetical protein
MAKRSSSRAIVRAVPMRASAPVIRVSAPRAPSRKKHRRSHSVGGSAKVTQKTMMAAAIGGAALGFVDKNFPTLPTIPMLGRAGTIALVAYMLAGRGGLGTIAKDVALAGAAVAGYELGKEGKISGGEIMGVPGAGGVMPQVSGRGVYGQGPMVSSQV